MQTVSIFVDVQNIYYTTREAFGRHFNYQKFWNDVTENREVVAAVAYAIQARFQYLKQKEENEIRDKRKK